MSLIHLLIYIAVIGLVVWLVVTYIPMPPIFKTVIMVIAALAVILLLLSLTPIADIRIGR